MSTKIAKQGYCNQNSASWLPGFESVYRSWQPGTKKGPSGCLTAFKKGEKTEEKKTYRAAVWIDCVWLGWGLHTLGPHSAFARLLLGTAALRPWGVGCQTPAAGPSPPAVSVLQPAGDRFRQPCPGLVQAAAEAPAGCQSARSARAVLATCGKTPHLLGKCLQQTHPAVTAVPERLSTHPAHRLSSTVTLFGQWGGKKRSSSLVGFYSSHHPSFINVPIRNTLRACLCLNLPGLIKLIV